MLGMTFKNNQHSKKQIQTFPGRKSAYRLIHTIHNFSKIPLFTLTLYIVFIIIKPYYNLKIYF
jgi:hypothetical protein